MKTKARLTAVPALALLGGLALTLNGHRATFAHAVAQVSPTTLLIAAALHIGTVLARSEAWSLSVRAAGAKVDRRSLYQVSSLGFAANVLACSLGAALKIWALRVKAKEDAPPVSALISAEVPVIALQALVTAVMSVSLLSPLGAPWWIAPIVLGVAGALVATLSRLARRFRGLAALRSGPTRRRILGCVLCVAALETLRNLLLLRAVGLHAGPWEAMALLVGAGIVGTLPLGPASSAGAAMLIFGASGVGPAAAAGVLLTATGFAADLAYAAWGAGDLLWRSCPIRTQRLPRLVDLGAALCVATVAAVALT